MKKFIINEKGLTLIELITSITILSVVMISLFTFFTNAFRFNSVNSDDIQAMNIAREQKVFIKEHEAVMAKLLDNVNWTADEANEAMDADEANLFHVKESTNKVYILESPNSDYDVAITIEKEPQYDDTFNNLHKVHVEVMKNEKLLSETYSYFESERVNENGEN